MNSGELDDVFRDVFRGSAAVAAGVLTRGRLRGPEFQRLFRDVYVRASVPVTHELRCRAASLALPAGAVITGRSAASVHGVRVAGPEDPVQIVAPAEMRLGRRKGLDVLRTVLGPGDAEPWAYGLPASPTRLTLDLLPGRPLADAVAGLDAVLRAQLVEHEHIARLVAGRSDNGIVDACRAVGLADPRAESLPESLMRVHLVLAGLDVVPQFPVELGGGAARPVRPRHPAQEGRGGVRRRLARRAAVGAEQGPGAARRRTRARIPGLQPHFGATVRSGQRA